MSYHRNAWRIPVIAGVLANLRQGEIVGRILGVELDHTVDNGLLLGRVVQHATFIIELLNNAAVQKTLFRKPLKIRKESFVKMMDNMYGEKEKEITYILEKTSFLRSTPFGYVKIKLIDRANKSCYISIASLPDPEYRGKGYAKATYDTFFEYLYPLGFEKIYGRTYEENIPTIKLNITTGFRFIG